MSSQYLYIPSHLSRQDSRGNESFTNAYPRRPYPLTPYPTISETEDWSSSLLGTQDNLVHTTEKEAGRRARTYFAAPSTYGLCYSSPTPSLQISSTELQKVLDSFLDQVDWLEVAEKVARNRAPSIYFNAIEKILIVHIYQLVKIEGENDDAAQFGNSNNDKGNVPVYKGDDDGSEFERDSGDEDGDSDEDSDDDEDIKEDRDEADEEDDINEDDDDGDSESKYKE
ncbi:hypothetical protein N7G274_000659 [Stereocaulon virgatum]|uniref:Uncharacterized protein n=1 Tax=Stereocaulon virgatum TaxID=373712 RepID=A0ABR4APE9_9LECA